MLRPVPPQFVRHASALHAQGYRPGRLREGEILAPVAKLDGRQHVDDDTWEVLTMMDLPVRGEVLAGNPSIRIGQPAGEAPPMDNGILTQVGGFYVAEGAMRLPTPCLAEAQELRRTVVVEVPHLGPVRLTYELAQHKHGRSRHWSWRAKRADRVDAL